MRQIYNSLLILILMIILWSCQRLKSDPYAETIYRYFKEVHQKDYQEMDEKREMIVIPLNACAPCINDLMAHLLKTHKNGTTLVIAGASEEEEVLEKLKQLKVMYSIMLDPNNYLNKYRMNISGPVYLIISNTHIIKTELDSDSLSKVI